MLVPIVRCFPHACRWTTTDRYELVLTFSSSGGIDTLTSNGPAHVLIWAMKPISFARHRFPPDVIRHAVWLYLREIGFSGLHEQGLLAADASSPRDC
jgi:hypothetical protein